MANKPIRKALSTGAHSCIVYCLCEGSRVSMSCLTTSHGERFVHNLLGKTRIFQRRFIKSRTQCACFSDLLPLPMYPHRMSKCLFGKLLWGKACKGWENLAPYLIPSASLSPHRVYQQNVGKGVTLY